MKFFKNDDPYIPKRKWKQILLAMSIMTIVLYVIAIICSLCGSKYFILNYQNPQMDSIEAFLSAHKIYPLIVWIFTTIEFVLVLSFIIKKIPKWYYILSFYSIAMIVSAVFPSTPIFFYQIYPFVFYLIIPIIEQRKITWKKYGISILRLIIAISVTLILQAMITVIKAGYFDGQNHILPLSGFFIYSLEYDIALLVILSTISLYINKEKGDSELWVTYQDHGGSSQISKKKSFQSSMKKNLTKTQRTKLRLLYVKVYLIQLGAFAIVMILPFLLGKVFEFLVMYFAFCIVRYILGFNYSLHYKKESICVTVGAVVFGILSLAVPFFNIVIIIAITLGISLAVLLHLSYKYKSFYLFAKMSKPDKFATFYVLFDGNLTEQYILKVCKYNGLDKEESHIVSDYMQGDKLFYLSKKYNYSIKTLDRKLNDAIDLLNM